MRNEIDYNNIFDYLTAECEKKGTNITALCTEAKVNRQNIEKWKGNNPKTLDTLALLLKALNNFDKKKKTFFVSQIGVKLTR